jgi:hypothetical protein
LHFTSRPHRIAIFAKRSSSGAFQKRSAEIILSSVGTKQRFSRTCLVPRRLRKINHRRPQLMELHSRAVVVYAVVFTRSVQGDHVMQKRRAVRNALFFLAACATAQAAGLTESSARTSPGTRHDLPSRSPKVRHTGLSGGIASVYSGGGTASGERMNPGAFTAAHPA